MQGAQLIGTHSSLVWAECMLQLCSIMHCYWACIFSTFLIAFLFCSCRLIQDELSVSGWSSSINPAPSRPPAHYLLPRDDYLIVFCFLYFDSYFCNFELIILPLQLPYLTYKHVWLPLSLILSGICSLPRSIIKLHCLRQKKFFEVVLCWSRLPCTQNDNLAWNEIGITSTWSRTARSRDTQS